MSLIVLPHDTGPDARAEADRKLRAAIEDPLTVVMLVYGGAPDVDKALEVCVARASVKAAIRRVVWIPDPGVLPSDLAGKYKRSGKVAVAIGLDDKVADALTKTRAQGRIFVERAFLAAEAAGA